jgi:hypothetical protein
LLLAPDSNSRRSNWEPTSFLASREPIRATRRLSRRGWLSLRNADPTLPQTT